MGSRPERARGLARGNPEGPPHPSDLNLSASSPLPAPPVFSPHISCLLNAECASPISVSLPNFVSKGTRLGDSHHVVTGSVLSPHRHPRTLARGQRPEGTGWQSHSQESELPPNWPTYLPRPRIPCILPSGGEKQNAGVNRSSQRLEFINVSLQNASFGEYE